ncbi:hypothetical protein NDU88_005105 [Pleurodeles waltl]|uniref:Secreted protein n=1 Tax=Pleurodeles waltl TaxID=8319 RepID=A0AAV7WAV5_PLEWA|nr:hypothetical protein NDU88_005105 [Pleurodeles waltl]
MCVARRRLCCVVALDLALPWAWETLRQEPSKWLAGPWQVESRSKGPERRGVPTAPESGSAHRAQLPLPGGSGRGAGVQLVAPSLRPDGTPS